MHVVKCIKMCSVSRLQQVDAVSLSRHLTAGFTAGMAQRKPCTQLHPEAPSAGTRTVASQTETFNTKCSGLLDDECFRVMYSHIITKSYCGSIVTSFIPRPPPFLPSICVHDNL